MGVRRNSRGASELTIHHRAWAELGVRTHAPRPHLTITNQPPREKPPLCIVLSVVVVLAAAACDNYACLLSPLAYLCSRQPQRTVSAVRAALAGLFLAPFTCYVVTDPVLTLCVIDATTAVHYFFCYGKQQHSV